MGGGQLVSLRVASSLRGRGFDVRFASPSRGDFTQQSDDVAPTDVVAGSSLRQAGAVLGIARYLRRTRAALVHTHTPAAATILWRIGARLASVPIVNHVHIFNYFGPPGVRSGVARKLDALTREIPRAFVAVSDDTRNGLVAEGYAADRIITIHNSIPWPRQERLRPQADADPVIGCIGRISPAKGQRDLIEAFVAIHRDHPRAKLWIIGGADAANRRCLDELRLRADAPELEGAVTFMGNRDDVRDLLRRMTVLVLPSRHEAFPLVLLEAMSVGVPVIATSVGGVAELVRDADEGVLLEPGDVPGLVRAIAGLMTDVAARESLSRRAYDSVWSRFDDGHTLDRVVTLIAEEASRARSD
jgi:glycosyltransferase involved in cell wall biosynthesis